MECLQFLCLTIIITVISCVGEGSEFLSFRKGDLIVLGNERGEDVMTSGWCYGECVRTQAKGDFPAECVYVLPTLRKPPAQVLVCVMERVRTTVDANVDLAPQILKITCLKGVSSSRIIIEILHFGNR